MKMAIVSIVLIVVAVVIAMIWWRQNGGVSHSEILCAVQKESESVRQHVDGRSRELNIKLDRIEAKLDRLLKLADRPLPDGMHPAE